MKQHRSVLCVLPVLAALAATSCQTGSSGGFEPIVIDLSKHPTGEAPPTLVRPDPSPMILAARITPVADMEPTITPNPLRHICA